jgi:hypothetical protein
VFLLAGLARNAEGWGKGISGFYEGPSRSSQAKKPVTAKSSTGKPSSEQKKVVDQGAKKPLSTPQNKLPQSFAAPKMIAARPVAGAVMSNPASIPAKPVVAVKTRPNGASGASKSTTNAKISAAAQATKFAKPKTNASGKVVPARSSLPQNKNKSQASSTKPTTSSAGYKGPLPIGGSDFKSDTGYTPFQSTREYKPQSGYQGPLDLKGVAAAGPTSKGPKATNSVTANRPKAAGNQGPINLGGLA